MKRAQSAERKRQVDNFFRCVNNKFFFGSPLFPDDRAPRRVWRVWRVFWGLGQVLKAERWAA